MQLSDSEAEELVTLLQEKRCAGNDDLALITWLSNRFRVGKNESRALHDSFYRGFQDGADSVHDFVDHKSEEPRPPASGDILYCAAYRLGQKSFAAEYERSLRRHRPQGCLGMVLLFGTVLIAAICAAG